MNNEKFMTENQFEEEKENTTEKITGLKISKYVFTVLAGLATLVTTPITTGISIAAGLGALISEISLEKEIDDNKLAATK